MFSLEYFKKSFWDFFSRNFYILPQILVSRHFLYPGAHGRKQPFDEMIMGQVGERDIQRERT